MQSTYISARDVAHSSDEQGGRAIGSEEIIVSKADDNGFFPEVEDSVYENDVGLNEDDGSI